MLNYHTRPSKYEIYPKLCIQYIKKIPINPLRQYCDMSSRQDTFYFYAI